MFLLDSVSKIVKILIQSSVWIYRPTREIDIIHINKYYTLLISYVLENAVIHSHIVNARMECTKLRNLLFIWFTFTSGLLTPEPERSIFCPPPSHHTDHCPQLRPVIHWTALKEEGGTRKRLCTNRCFGSVLYHVSVGLKMKLYSADYTGVYSIYRVRESLEPGYTYTPTTPSWSPHHTEAMVREAYIPHLLMLSY